MIKEEQLNEIIDQVDVLNPVNEDILSKTLYSTDISKLWKIFVSLEGNEALKLLKDMVRIGINMKFDITFITEGHYIKYPDSQRVKIKGHEKMSWREFQDEIELREVIMNRVLEMCFEGHDRQGGIEDER